jgi:hypothetical protein
MGRLGIALVLAAVLGFVGWQIWRVHSAAHTAFYQRPYRTSHFKKALSAFEKRAGADVSLFDLRLTSGGVFFTSLEPDGVKDYRIDENGKVLSVHTLSSDRNLTNVYPVARVDVEAPQRIFDAIAKETGHDEYLLRAELARNSDGALRWEADAGKLGFGTGGYEALPDGTLVKRPAEPQIAAYVACLKRAGTNQTKANACRKLLGETPAARAAAFQKCLKNAKTRKALLRCDRAFAQSLERALPK